MEFSAAAIAKYLKGTVEGDPKVKVKMIAKIEDGNQGDLSFLANPKYEQYIYTTKSSVVLVNNDFKPSAPITATLIRVENSYIAFASLMQLVEQNVNPKKNGIHRSAVIEKSAKIGKRAYIGAGAYIGENCEIGEDVSIYPQVYIGDNVKIGNGTTLNAGVKIYHHCVIGNHCTIHAGTVIGADGFGFAPKSADEFMKIPQLGNVVVEDNVEIGANTTIDRATMGSTFIRKGVKIDNLIQVAHNVEIGENTVIAAQTGISGSTKIGKNCMVAGQVGFVGHIVVADGTKVGAQSGVTKSVKKENSSILGSFAFDSSQYVHSFAAFKNLPELRDKVLSIERQLSEK